MFFDFFFVEFFLADFCGRIFSDFFRPFFFPPCISCGVRRSTACLPVMARHLSIILASCLVLSCVQYSLHKFRQRYGNTKALVFEGLTPFPEVEMRLVKTKDQDPFTEAFCVLCLLMLASANNFHPTHRIPLLQKPSTKSVLTFCSMTFWKLQNHPCG